MTNCPLTSSHIFQLPQIHKLTIRDRRQYVGTSSGLITVVVSSYIVMHIKIETALFLFTRWHDDSCDRRVVCGRTSIDTARRNLVCLLSKTVLDDFVETGK